MTCYRQPNMYMIQPFVQPKCILITPFSSIRIADFGSCVPETMRNTVQLQYESTQSPVLYSNSALLIQFCQTAEVSRTNALLSRLTALPLAIKQVLWNGGQATENAEVWQASSAVSNSAPLWRLSSATVSSQLRWSSA